MVVTRQSNADAHPGDIVWKVQRKRRTAKEIEDDKAKGKAKSAAAKEKAASKRHAVISTVAGLRASVEREEEAIQVHTNRPNRHHGSSSATRTAAALIQEKQLPIGAWKNTNTVHDSTV